MPDAAPAGTLRERAMRRWERFSSWPFLVLSIVFIVVYSIRCLDPVLEADYFWLIWTVLLVIWAAFIADYVARMLLSEHKWDFVRHNVPELLAALVPVFRPFRLLRELHRIPFFTRRTGSAVRARVVSSAAAFVVLWVYMISVTVVHAERGADGATILSLGDALYWSVVTITTVGYGDMVPVTTFGRVLAVMLMLSGILILGVTTATVVSYFNDAVGRSGSGLRRARQHDGTRDEEERQ